MMRVSRWMKGRVNRISGEEEGDFFECNIDSPSNRRSMTESRSISFCSAIVYRCGCV